MYKLYKGSDNNRYLLRGQKAILLMLYNRKDASTLHLPKIMVFCKCALCTNLLYAFNAFLVFIMYLLFNKCIVAFQNNCELH